MIVHYVYQDPRGYGYNKKMSYKVPKIGTKTDKGKWLNAFINWFFVPHKDHDYHWKTAKNKIDLKTTVFNINNNKAALVGFFKNLKKLKQTLHYRSPLGSKHSADQQLRCNYRLVIYLYPCHLLQFYLEYQTHH